jgi:DNA repair protein RecO (recombination protein O)
VSYADDGARDVDAYLLRRTEFGDADLVLLLFTLQLGNVSVMARSARKSTRRFSGALEPFHRIALRLSAPKSGDLYQLREARIDEVRLGLVRNLAAMDVAGRVLGWVRRVLPTATPEPEIFRAIDELMARLDDANVTQPVNGNALLTEFGLALLRHLGWELQMRRCIRCGRACPPNVPATIDPQRGGLVCRTCGGARFRISADLRTRMDEGSYDSLARLASVDAALALDLVEKTLHSHLGLDTA